MAEPKSAANENEISRERLADWPLHVISLIKSSANAPQTASLRHH